MSAENPFSSYYSDERLRSQTDALFERATPQLEAFITANNLNALRYYHNAPVWILELSGVNDISRNIHIGYGMLSNDEVCLGIVTDAYEDDTMAGKRRMLENAKPIGALTKKDFEESPDKLPNLLSSALDLAKGISREDLTVEIDIQPLA